MNENGRPKNLKQCDNENTKTTGNFRGEICSMMQDLIRA